MKPEHQEYEGHQIELRELEGKPELLIDNLKVHYGKLPNGQYFLHEYAYDWSDNLITLAQRFIDYRRKVDKIQHQHNSRKGGK